MTVFAIKVNQRWAVRKTVGGGWLKDWKNETMGDSGGGKQSGREAMQSQL